MAAEFEHLPLMYAQSPGSMPMRGSPISVLNDGSSMPLRTVSWATSRRRWSSHPKNRMENILLIGESGMGKTMLVRKFERQNAAKFDDVAGLQRRPVVAMLMPAPSDGDSLLRSAACRGECAGGRPFHSQLSLPRTRHPLATTARHPGVVIDELNSVLAGTPRQQRVFLQLLRFLSNELRIAFVGVGRAGGQARPAVR